MRQIPDRRLAKPGRLPSDIDGDLDEETYKSIVAATGKRGRPATERGAYNPNPARQLGRVSDEDWETLKAAATASGKSFTTWAVAILLRAARRVGK